jgi:hypothetical protein
MYTLLSSCETHSERLTPQTWSLQVSMAEALLVALLVVLHELLSSVDPADDVLFLAVVAAIQDVERSDDMALVGGAAAALLHPSRRTLGMIPTSGVLACRSPETLPGPDDAVGGCSHLIGSLPPRLCAQWRWLSLSTMPGGIRSSDSRMSSFLRSCRFLTCQVTFALEDESTIHAQGHPSQGITA